MQVFRLNASEDDRSFALHGLEATRSYRFTDPYSHERFERPVGQLLKEGLGFDLPKMSSRVLLYEPAGTPH